jgi:mono/diheme cytochrome c family protein
MPVLLHAVWRCLQAQKIPTGFEFLNPISVKTIMAARRLLFGIVIAIAILAGSFFFFAWRPAIAERDSADKLAFAPALVATGSRLAAVGNCAVCHTKVGGKPFAGGRPMVTRFGTIYSTNITPDPDTGIGKWSEAAFVRALREGVDRAGRHLYPAFPYDHFAKLTSEDIRAIYAFVMTRNPIHTETPPNKLVFPINFRPIVAGWKLLYLDKQEFRPDAGRSEAWNRGAYLVEGLGHCGACHTPRNLFGAEKQQQFLAGGEAEGWYAPALNSTTTAAVPWSGDRIFNYLRHGREELHGTATGPMAPVVGNLSRVPEPEVRAIAAYVASLAGRQMPQEHTEQAMAFAKRSEYGFVPLGTPAAVAPDPRSGDPRTQSGAAIFAGACASCHHSSGNPLNRPMELGLSTLVTAPDPRNLIHVVLKGMAPAAGEKGSLMPGFAGALTEPQFTDLVNYVRSHFSDRPAWPDVQEQVKEIVHHEEP